MSDAGTSFATNAIFRSTAAPVPTDRRWRVEAVALAAVAAQMLLLGVVLTQDAVPVERLFRDLIAVAEELPGCCHVYDGMISNIGILLWWSTATLSGLAALVLALQSRAPRDVTGFAVAAVFSAWLASDDLFMLHESVLPLVGLPQFGTFLIYGGLAAAYLLLAWRTVVARAPLFVVLALAMLGGSAAVDVMSDHDFGAVTTWLLSDVRLQTLLDDGLKFLGIGFWFGLHLVAATAVLCETDRLSIHVRTREGDAK